jgi:hypothetical protein
MWSRRTNSPRRGRVSARRQRAWAGRRGSRSSRSSRSGGGWLTDTRSPSSVYALVAPCGRARTRSKTDAAAPKYLTGLSPERGLSLQGSLSGMPVGSRVPKRPETVPDRLVTVWPTCPVERSCSAQPLSCASAIRLTSAASTCPLCVFMISPTRRPTCFGSVMPSAPRRSRTSACRAASSSPFGR